MVQIYLVGTLLFVLGASRLWGDSVAIVIAGVLLISLALVIKIKPE